MPAKASARAALEAAAIAVVALSLGVGSAVVAINGVWRAGGLTIGPWATSVTAGGPRAGLYERAAVAVHALLVLGRAESLYYHAHKDGSGRALSARCDYEIRGSPPPARWWSLTAYGDDDFLIPNAEHRYSFNMANTLREPDGRFVIRASPRPQKGNWLPLGAGGGRVSFTLRLYNPERDVAMDPARAPLPTIVGNCP